MLGFDALCVLTLAQASAGTLLADVGTFTLTGNDANLRAARKIGADAGVFSLSGQSVSIRATHLPLVAGVGTFTLNGQAALLTRDVPLVAAAGEFTLTGWPLALYTQMIQSRDLFQPRVTYARTDNITL